MPAPPRRGLVFLLQPCLSRAARGAGVLVTSRARNVQLRCREGTSSDIVCAIYITARGCTGWYMPRYGIRVPSAPARARGLSSLNRVISGERVPSCSAPGQTRRGSLPSQLERLLINAQGLGVSNDYWPTQHNRLLPDAVRVQQPSPSSSTFCMHSLPAAAPAPSSACCRPLSPLLSLLRCMPLQQQHHCACS
jgi:hypothetical protein